MLGIFAMHAAITLAVLGRGWDAGRPYILEAGRTSLAVFFVLSGFLLYLPFALARMSRGPPPALKAYYVRRGARIIPAYWFVLLTCALLFGWSDVLSAEGFVTYFGFLQVYEDDTISRGLSPAWAIDVLVLFYLVLPAWAALMRRIPTSQTATFARTEAGMLLALGLAGLGYKIWAYGEVEGYPGGSRPGSALLVALPAWMDYFAIGMGMAVAFLLVSARGEDRPAPARAIARWPGVAWVAAAMILLLLVAFDPWVERGLMTDQEDPGILAAHVLAGLAAVAVLLPTVFGTARRGLVTRFLSTPPLVVLGTISYGFFLWHGPVLQELWQHVDTLGTWGYVATALVISLAAGALSYLLVERPLLRLGHRLPRRAAGGRAVQVPALRRLPSLAPALLAVVVVAVAGWRLSHGPVTTPARLELVSAGGGMEIASPTGTTPVVKGAATGAVRWTGVCGPASVMGGWAIDRRSGRAVDRVLVFDGRRLLADVTPGMRRVDAIQDRTDGLERTGFVAAAPVRSAGVRVFALAGRRASELKVPARRPVPPSGGATQLRQDGRGLAVMTPSGPARVAPGAVRGTVDHVLAWGPSLVVIGWAADTARRRLPDCILVFAGRRLLAAAPPSVRRRDLALIYSSAIDHAGFQFKVPMVAERARRLAAPGHVRVVAVAGRRASLVPGPAAP